MTKFTVGSLFSGIGGLDLGLEWAGLGPVLWQVERDPFCRDILAKHWPDARRHEDVRTITGADLGAVDVLCGGFPCQDVSLAGAGAGLSGERSGLWYEYLRIIAEIRPRGVVIKNVAGLVRRGLDVVVGGLCDLGYAVEGTRIRASDLGAPHRRERVFLVAYADGAGRNERPGVGGIGRGRGESSDGREGLADTDREGRPQPRGDLGESRGRVVNGGEGMGDAAAAVRANDRAGSAFAGLGIAADGLLADLDRAARACGWPGWPAGRGADQYDYEPPRTGHKIPDRGRRVKALGNAVVPHCAYVAGMRLRERLETMELRE